MKRIGLISLILATAALVAAVLSFSRALPQFDYVRSHYQSSDQAILDRYGQVIDELRVDKKIRRLHWVNFDQFPPTLRDAVVAAEDKRFYLHPGVDPLSLSKALMQRLMGRTDRGASTISMQVSALLTEGKRQGRRGLLAKAKQIVGAFALETKWSKKEIFEAYLNLVAYRGELQGLAAASFGLFDKAPFALTHPEAATLAALIRSPNAPVERVKERACWLLETLKISDCSGLTADLLSPLKNGYQIRSYMKLAPHIARRLSKDTALKDQRVVRSTLDRTLQWVATHALRKQITSLMAQNLNDGAVVVIENATGNVLAYVGNIGAGSKAPYVDAAVAERQAGSSLKPFIYAQAIDLKLLTAATVLEDTPLGIQVATGMYKPANFDNSFRDLVSVRSSLASSLNIPAVRAIEMVGVERFVQTMTDMGFSHLQRPDYYGPSLALGAADIKLLELTNAYRTLANGGIWSPVKFYESQISDQVPRRIFSKQASFIVSDIISDRQARAATFGLDNTLSTRFWSAVKTGTSKDMRDNWCVGFSQKYTVGVWAGNFGGESMWNVSGVQGAAPVWQEVMNFLHRKEDSLNPEPPPGLVAKHVRFAFSGQQQDEWFIAGTEPSNDVIQAHSEVRSHISYPLDQALVAMDPDIPETNHRMVFEVEAPQAGQWIYLNNQRLGKAQSFTHWKPRKGQFKLELRAADGRVIDSVRFEVRGRRFALAQ